MSLVSARRPCRDRGRQFRSGRLLSIIVAWVCGGGIASAQLIYRVVPVAPSSATSSTSAQIDPTGTYVTGIAAEPVPSAPPQPPTSEARVFLWSAGTSAYLAKGPGMVAFDSSVVVNASGQVVGTAGSSGQYPGTTAAYRWSASAQTPLQGLPPAYNGPTNTAALAINASGDAVGRSDLNPSTVRAVRWQAGSTSVTPVSDVMHAIGRGISDAGVVVGNALVYPCPARADIQCWRATRWAAGQVTLLEPAPGFTHSSAYDINEAGQIVGRAWNGNTEFAAMLWSGSTVTALPALNTQKVMWANGLNAAGHIVGRYRSDRDKGFLYRDGTTFDLTGLLDASGAGKMITDANSISDDGKIAATACQVSGGTCAAVVLIPSTPAPPIPAHTRYLAEGATSEFFDTQIALLNPGSNNASTTLQYLPTAGPPITQGITVPARTRVTINPKLVSGLAVAEFSTVVQTSEELVVDRTMSWDATGYGSHSETAVKAPQTTWYLAEGATIGGFSLFYLLQNPAMTPTTVQVRYLRTVGTPLVKSYVLPPQSRTNIWVNVEDFPGLGRALANAEFSAVIESLDATPIIVERAMYRSNQGRTFNAGHESTAVSAPATDWFLAEGATGAFFDMFVLIANPTSTDAQVKITYLTIDGTTYSRTLTAPANSRSGIWVDEETFPGVSGKPLADAAISTTVESVNSVPLVVERAMWWPGDSSTWHEAHNSAGAVATGTRWAVAEGEVGGARGHETYLLIANTSPSAGSARVTLHFEDGTSTSRTYTLPASSRTNVAVGPAFGNSVTGRRFGAVIESTGTSPAQIVVERAMYSNGFAAGTSALATRLQ